MVRFSGEILEISRNALQPSTFEGCNAFLQFLNPLVELIQCLLQNMLYSNKVINPGNRKHKRLIHESNTKSSGLSLSFVSGNLNYLL